MSALISLRRGVVKEIAVRRGDFMEVVVTVGGSDRRAVVYPKLTGGVGVGDEVVVNVTAVELGLGSGGVDFVTANLSIEGREFAPAGHVMKMNYTPLQGKVLSAEEKDSPHRDAIEGFSSLGGIPVVVGSLHSMVAPVAGAVERLTGGGARVAYVMTDGACLPLPFSRTVRELKDRGLLAGTVTYGNAFGGDLEAVNKYTALIAAREALSADVIVAAMGVGSIGTGTRYGYSAIEQGEILNAAKVLGGTPVACVRMSFADARERHRGISHHAVTALMDVAMEGMFVPLPVLEGGEREIVAEQIRESGLGGKHVVVERDGAAAMEALKKHRLEVTTMGRGPADDPVFFSACGAAAALAVEHTGRAGPRGSSPPED
ncbi:MAG: DUF3866 family protein [bacterium]